MPNVTLSIDEKLLKSGREYARKHNTSLNALIRNLLRRTIENQDPDWIHGVFSLMDSNPVSSEGKKWSREELYK